MRRRLVVQIYAFSLVLLVCIVVGEVLLARLSREVGPPGLRERAAPFVRYAMSKVTERWDDPAAMRAFSRKFGISSLNWLFLTPETQSLGALTAELGFRYQATTAGFDHLLQVSILDRDGRVYRQVYGDSFDAPLFVGPLLQLAQNAPVPAGSVQAFLEQVKLLCTVYDPSAGRYRLNYVVIIELLVGSSVMIGGIGFLVIEWRRRRRQPADPKTRAAQLS